jgi:hypothetical protein
MDTDFYTVYVFHLKNGWRYLYPKNQNIEVGSVSNLMTEFQYSCGLFGDDYQAVELLRTHNNVSSYNINGLILHYMHIYGIEHVRGGKYSKMTLSFDDKNEISNMIKYFSHELQEEEEKTSRFHNYVKEYAGLNKDQIWRERNKIDKILLSYHKTKKQYDKINIVSESHIGKIVWLKEICENPTCREGCFIYSDLFEFTANILDVYYFYGNNFENASETIDLLKTRHSCAKNVDFLPSFNMFFEKIIFQKDEYYKTFLPYILDLIEMIFHTIRNKTKELESICNQINYTENMERNHTLTTLLISKEVSKPWKEEL